MAKNKRPFSSLLENPEARKAVQDALHAPAQLPTVEAHAPTPEPTPVPPIASTVEPEQTKPEPAKKGDTEDSEPYQVVTVRKSVHRFLKMASVHYGIEIREIASEAIANHPKVKHMMELMDKK